MGRSSVQAPDCNSCQHFLDRYQDLERELVGMTALSSALGSTRGSAGICGVTSRFHDPAPACADYLARAAATDDPTLLLPDRNNTARAAATPRPTSGGHA
jgi:hypothetical protein